MDSYHLRDVLFSCPLSRHVILGAVQLVGFPLEAEEVQDNSSSHVLHSGHCVGYNASVLQHMVFLWLVLGCGLFRLPNEAGP